LELYSTAPVQVFQARSLSISDDVFPVSNATSISALSQATCATVGSNGGVVCWGRNAGSFTTGKELGFQVTDPAWPGQGFESIAARPVQLPGEGDLAGIAKISAGRRHICALSSTAVVYCWGVSLDNETGENNTVIQPSLVAGVDHAISISSGRNHSCALLENGSAKCWGGNIFGQLWNGSSETTNYSSSILDSRGANRNDVSSVLTGDYSTCIVTSDHAFKCAGLNTYGQFMQAARDYSMSGVESFDMGQYFGCAVLVNHEVHCWGTNNGSGPLGQIGRDGQYIDYVQTKPVAYEDGRVIDNAISVAAGGNFACAVLSTGKAACWGSNSYGQLGANQSSENHYAAVIALERNGQPLTGVIQVESGTVHACALSNTGHVSCWGWGYFGETIVPAGNASFVSLGLGYYHSCAVDSEKVAHCWGRGDGYQLGNGIKGNSNSIIAIPNTRKIAGSEQGSCLIQYSGEVYCWGFNSYGQAGGLPDTFPYDVALPRQVAGIDDAVDISMGDYHTCVVRSDRTTWCWGNGVHGQLGNGDPFGVVPGSSMTPVLATQAPPALSVRTGKDSTCVLEVSLNISCWGVADRSIQEFGSGRTYDDWSPGSSARHLSPIRVLRALAPEIADIQSSNTTDQNVQVQFILKPNLDVTTVSFSVVDTVTQTQIASSSVRGSWRDGSGQELKIDVARVDVRHALSLTIRAQNSVGEVAVTTPISGISTSSSTTVSTTTTTTTTTTVPPTTTTTSTTSTTTILPPMTTSTMVTQSGASGVTGLSGNSSFRLKVSKTASAKSVATFAKIRVLSTSKVSLKVAASSTKLCRVSGTSLKGLKVGSCKVAVTVKPKKGKAVSKTITLKVTK
jgi:alpha-tubulin suppressor-like RCC1 family protein